MGGVSGSTADETFRGTVRDVATSDCGPATVIVTRQGVGRSGRVWLTTGAAMPSTVILTDDQADKLIALVAAARDARSADPAG